MPNYYAIDRSEEYLAHYGIKGMKWGVRRAIERGDNRAYNKHYRKAMKKLAKLEKYANNGAKYARRAAALGTAAGVTGSLAFNGVGGIVNQMTKKAEKLRAASKTMAGANIARAELNAQNLDNAAKKMSDWSAHAPFAESAKKKADQAYHNAVVATTDKTGKLYNLSDKAKREYRMAVQKQGEKSVDAANRLNRGALVRAGAIAATAGLAGAAGYNAYRAATTKRAARKAEEWRNEIDRTFGTHHSKKKRQR